MAMVRKKQDDKYLEALRELITTGGGNRQCFDCGQKGPTYVNMTIGSFVCTRCSGVLRGITPPHRVKSISMATFTQDELDFLKAHGNDVCAKTWLGLWDPKRAVHQDQRELMIDKYERKRYFLEPASPLKSLTNATNLKTTAAATSSSASTTSSATAIAASTANHNSQNNNSNSKTQIQLTPPTSQRTTANGLHKTSSTAISRPHHSTPPQVQNGFSSSLSTHTTTTDAFGLHNGLNSSVGSMSTGALSDTSSCASANGFGAEADFVADFGSADIFNAAVVNSSPASSIGSATTKTISNGYAKIQPMKISTAAHQQFMNGHGGGGSLNSSTNLQNGNSNGKTENFADFDHAPIYNAAGLPINNNNNNKNSATNGFNNNNNINHNNNNNNNNNNSSAPAEDRYAALKDLDEQLRESKAVAAQAASIVTANVVDSGFGSPHVNGTVNPFSAHQQQQTNAAVNPFQNASNNSATQQQQSNATQQLFGQMTLIPNGIAAANGFLNAQKTHTANTGFFNYTASGFTNTTNNTQQLQQQPQQHQASTLLYPTSIQTGPNGCGFGFGTLQQQIASNGTGLTTNTFNNPFAATGALNSNNPFL